MVVVLVLLLLFVGYSLLEYALHRRDLGRIPIRIQVNGTRGKSSVTRLIAAGLRAGGRRVVAKTTGTRPMFITGDSEERPVRRLGKANIAEQLRIVRLAREFRAEALVLENMSLDPQYQSVEHAMLVRPTHSVVTNVRADHLDVMGPTVADVARAFSRTVSGRGDFFTTQTEYMGILCRRAGPEMSRVVTDGAGVTDEMLDGFSHIEHRENVALALAVCERLGVDRGAALAGMQRSSSDPGAMRLHIIESGGRRLELVNALAANDPDSIAQLWRMVKHRDERRIVLVNCRSDRPDRSRQLADLVAGFEADAFVATGGLTRVFLRRIRRAGVDSSRLVDLGNERPPAEVLQGVFGLVGSGGTRSQSQDQDGIGSCPYPAALLFATGNTVGYGEELMRYFVGNRAGHGN